MHAIIIGAITALIIFGGFRLLDYWRKHPKERNEDHERH
jgi:hypothetical protein